MFERLSTIIKDSSKLSFDYVPPVLIGREAEMEALELMIGPVAEKGGSETAFITGNVGSGKTATVKRFCMEMSAYCSKLNIPFGYIFVNCRQKSSDSAILVQLVRQFDREFPEKGFSPAELLQIFRKHVLSSGRRYLLVFDEIDHLLKRGSTDLIYQLTRLSDDEYSKASVSLIMISQEYVLDRLDQASLSSFKRANTIRFKRYTKEKLIPITRSRAESAIVEGCYDMDVIELIADIASENGDARTAIDILDKSARIAEKRPNGIITAEDVREAKAFMYSVITEGKLRMLNTNKLLTLLAVSRSIKTKTYVTLPAAEKTYAIVCEEYDVQARKHTQFWSYINDLEREGFLKTIKRTEPGEMGGAVAQISLPDIPASTLSKKIENILEGNEDEL